MSSLILRTGRPLYNERMSDEEAILEEAMENLRESIQRLRAIQSRLHSTGLDENPNYRDLLHHVRTAGPSDERSRLHGGPEKGRAGRKPLGAHASTRKRSISAHEPGCLCERRNTGF